MLSLNERDPRVFSGLAFRTLLSITVWAIGLGAVCRAQTGAGGEAPPALKAGASLERPLSGGEIHTFQIDLASGQCLRVITDQQGIDVAMTISTIDGRQSVEMDSLNGTQGPEIAMVLAERPERYRIIIRSPGKDVPPGRYALRTEIVETAGERERQWIEAQQSYTQGRRLRAQPGAEPQTQSIGRFEDALSRWRALDEKLMAAHTLYYIADAHRRLGRLQQSLSVYDQARGLALESEEPREVATAETFIANLYSFLGEPGKSIEPYARALQQWRSRNDIYSEARIRLNLGVAYAMLGEPRKALEHYEQSLQVWRKLENRRQLADTLQNIGGAYELVGEWQKTLEAYDQSLSLYRGLGNQRGEAGALNNLGFVYEQLGESQKALEYYQNALDRWRAMGDRNEEAWTLMNIGFAYSRMSEPQNAMDYCRQSLQVRRGQEDRRGEGTTFLLMGDLLASSDRPAALEYYLQALPRLRAAEDRWREAAALRSLGLLYLSLGDWPRAQESLDQSLTLHRDLGARSGEAQTRYALARLWQERGEPAAALQQIESAIALVERLRADIGSQRLRASYLASAQKFYELDIDLLMRLHREQPAQGFDALAAQASERARARSLLESLAESRVNLKEGVDATLVERERELAELLSAKAAHQLRQRAGSPPSAALKQEISRLENEYEQIQASIRKTSPRYAALVQPQPISLGEIQRSLDENSLLLEYKLGEERSWLWAITDRTLDSYELPKRDAIELIIAQFRRQMSARSLVGSNETALGRRRRIAQADARLVGIANRLGSMILGPAAACFAGKRLIIVPDGALQYIPFAALPEPGQGAKTRLNVTHGPPSSTPLILDHEIVVLPSASTLAAQRRELSGRAKAPKLLAVLADPVFQAEDKRIGGSGKRAAAAAQEPPSVSRSQTRDLEHTSEEFGGFGRNIPRLPFTLREAERILALVPPAETFKATGLNAARAVALDPELGRFRYLHFATHGLIDSERPGLSALVLSLVDGNGRPQDGFLRLNDIYNLKLPAELVVLSACRTGLGKAVKGEGVIGLTQGFLYSGAARVMVSLWGVNDMATAELMTRFYRKVLREKQRPAAALRAAQEELWKQKQWRAPYYWAAFILQGEWR